MLLRVSTPRVVPATTREMLAPPADGWPETMLPSDGSALVNDSAGILLELTETLDSPERGGSCASQLATLGVPRYQAAMPGSRLRSSRRWRGAQPVSNL